MEDESRDGSTKPTSARKKKSVEQHMVKRKALADKNNIPPNVVLRGAVVANGKENKIRHRSITLKNRNVNEVLPKAAFVPSLAVAWKKVQKLPVITESEDIENVDDKGSESVNLKKENELYESSVSIISLSDSCFSTRGEQSKKNKRLSCIFEYSESLLYVQDYKNDIVKYLREKEKEVCLPSVPNCSQFPKLHTVIVNWLIKLLSDIGLEDELLFISITLLDRLFTKMYIPVNKLQLAAMACLWVAIKQNTNTAALATEIISTCKITASVVELVEMEFLLLSKLSFNIAVVEPLLFVNYYLNELKIREKCIMQICKYLLDIVLLDPRYSTMYPSLIGSAAVYVALSLCSKQALWKAMQHHTEFPELCQFSHISDAMLSELKLMCLDQAKFRAAYSKHRKARNGKISKRLVIKQDEVVFL